MSLNLEHEPFDWSATPLGPQASWSSALRTVHDLVMGGGFGMCAVWGSTRAMIYNDAFAPFLGQRHPAALGRSFSDVWSDVWDTIGPLYDRAMAGETVREERMPLTMSRNGYDEQTWWTFSYSPLTEDGKIVGVLDTAVEMTSAVVAERRAAAEAERNQLALAAGAILGTWVWNVPADAFEVDEAFAENFGLDPALGRTDVTLAQVVETVHPEDRPGLASAIEEALQRGGRYSHQYRVRRRDGKYHWLEANGHVEQDGAGRPTRFPGVLIDMGDRRALEQERDRATASLQALNETLEARVDQRTAELLSAQDALRQSQKMEAVGQLTGGVAHDFNNLLTVIRGSIDLLRKPDLPEERRRRYIDAVATTADRAAKLTGQLLAFSRRQALKPETFDVRAKLRGVTDMLDTVTGARVTVVVDLPTESCFVSADVSQFETALVNLAVNARDAMDGEGRLLIKVRCGRSLPAIRGHGGSDERFITVAVRDTGSGIAQDRLPRIFEPFYTTKEVGKGTGLGLSQVFGFAKQSGGDIDVASTVGEGTTFKLYLPEVNAPDGDVLQGLSTVPVAEASGLRVLVVEDNVEVGQFCRQILEDLNYSCEWAVNAEDALAMLDAEGASFDVVFSDVVMPGMGGLALARILSQTKPSLPVILASGYSHVLSEEPEHGFKLLNKPYSADQLAGALISAAQAVKASENENK